MGVQTVTATAYTSDDASTDAGAHAGTKDSPGPSTDADFNASAYDSADAGASASADTGTDGNNNACAYVLAWFDFVASFLG